MIITTKHVYNTSVECDSGPLGRVCDLLFDDRSWRVRHLVVRIGRWPLRRRVLVDPGDIAAADWNGHKLRFRGAAQELMSSPCLDTDPPVALQKQWQDAYVAFDAYWAGAVDNQPSLGDPHLRSTRAVAGHRVYGLDRFAGAIANFVIDDVGWLIRYLVVQVGPRRDRKLVTLEPRWVQSLSWDDRAVHIRLSQSALEECPAFDMCCEPSRVADADMPRVP